MFFPLDLTLDISNALEEGLGEGRGLSPEDLAQGLRLAEPILKGCWDLRRLGQLPFLDFLYNEDRQSEIIGLAASLKGRYKDIVLCGFGGSALGASVLVEGAQGTTRNLGHPTRPRLHRLDTLDPQTIEATWDLVDPSETLFLFSSYSGETLEVLTLFHHLGRRLEGILGAARLKDHITILTRDKEGPLRTLAMEKDLPVMSLPIGMVGRFSVLSLGHLFVAALCQVDILSVVRGARRMDGLVAPGRIGQNPAALSAAVLFMLARKQGRRCLVIWPYLDRLAAFSTWYRQLIAESLGKRRSLKGDAGREGLTPLIARGVATQHAELQLYLDGPQDKTFLFFTPSEKVEEEVGRLLTVSQQATERALKEQGNPCLRIEVPEMSEYCLGELLMLAEIQVILLGGLMEVNPYDQPAVETVKKYVRQLLNTNR